MVPAKPLPFDVPVTSMTSPASKKETSSVWPTSYPLASSTRNSRMTATFGRSLSWPASGFVSFLDGSTPIWTAV